MRRALVSVTTAITVGALVVALVLLMYHQTPTFRVTNSAEDSIDLSVTWLENSKEFGVLAPGEIIEFQVKGEAAITFIAKMASGTRLTSDPVYFSSGIVVYADVQEENIEVSYESGT